MLAALLACAVTARLGIWQLDRARMKEARQAQIDARRSMAPLDASTLGAIDRDPAAHVDRVVHLSGRWIGDGTIHLDNRALDGRAGFYLLTPLRLPDGGAVMVLRGWLPRHPADRTRLPPLVTPDGVIDVSGRVAPPPSRQFDLGDATAGTIRQNLDFADHARSLGVALRPWMLQQADPVPAADAPLRRDWPAPVVDIHKHLGYAAQWFALCALSAGLYVWFQLVRPRLRRPHAA